MTDVSCERLLKGTPNLLNAAGTLSSTSSASCKPNSPSYADETPFCHEFERPSTSSNILWKAQHVYQMSSITAEQCKRIPTFKMRHRPFNMPKAHSTSFLILQLQKQMKMAVHIIKLHFLYLRFQSTVAEMKIRMIVAVFAAYRDMKNTYSWQAKLLKIKSRSSQFFFTRSKLWTMNFQIMQELLNIVVHLMWYSVFGITKKHGQVFEYFTFFFFP